MARARHVAVDLHCHLLPGIDDGARDLHDALEMARQAEADGIAAICATPHIRRDHRVSLPELAPRLAACPRRSAGAGGVGSARAEKSSFPTWAGSSDRRVGGPPLGGGGRWILLEPGPGPLDERLDRAVAGLLGRGLSPVIAHPERHLAPDLPVRLRRLIDAGALVQATAAAVTDDASRPGMLELAKRGVIHVLGSDAHSSRIGRSVSLSAALAVLATVEPISAHQTWVAHTAPLAIVEGRAVFPPF